MNDFSDFMAVVCGGPRIPHAERAAYELVLFPVREFAYSSHNGNAKPQEGLMMGKLWTRKKMTALLALLGLLAAIVWWQHKPLLARFYVQRLGQADELSRESWVARVVALDEAAVPSLLACLGEADQGICDNVACALVRLVRTWGPEDARAHALLGEVTARFESLPVFAKNTALQIPIVLLKSTPKTQAPSPALTRLAGDLLGAAVNVKELRVATLHLAAALVEQVPQGRWLELCRGLALAGLNAADADTRVAAIELILRPPLRQDNDVLAKVVPLLCDKACQVRKTALLALGPARELVSDDDLLPLLHDVDEEVQNLCELALRSRGLPENHILLARLIGDPRPTARLEVLQHLQAASDLEPGVWLRRLCQDPAPAVRAAAVRAAASQSQVDLRDCLNEMARQDPSLTVRQLAGHYLARYRPTSGE